MNDQTLTIRHGRIDDNGHTQVKDFASHDKALAEASKKRTSEAGKRCGVLRFDDEYEDHVERRVRHVLGWSA